MTATTATTRPRRKHAAPRRRSPAVRILRTALRAVSTVLTFVMIALVLLITLGPRYLGFQTFYIRSGSMRPGTPVGALVVDTRAHADELKVGDVITFRRPDNPSEMVTHRIAAIEDSPSGKQFLTKGDANSVPDPWRVNATGDGWRMRYTIPYAGFVVGYLSAWLAGLGPGGALVIVLAVFALMAIWRTPTERTVEPAPSPAS